MALITICGYPCSGKSTRAEQIRLFLESKLANPDSVSAPGSLASAGTGPNTPSSPSTENSTPIPPLQVVTISDDSLNLPRSLYNESRTEKPARGALLSAMQRHANAGTVLIVDSPNYIKGYRYQMYCIARELRLRVCTVYVIATPELCKERNDTRRESGAANAYTPETLDNMIKRFEEPSSMVRWDSPLISLLWTDEGIPEEQIWDAVTKGDVKPPNAGTQAVPKAPSSALHTLEHTTSALVSSILSEQSAAGGSFPSTTSTPIPVTPTLTIRLSLPQRALTLSELQRLKRQFVTVHKKAITLGTVEKGQVEWGEESVANKFGRYLEENMRG